MPSSVQLHTLLLSLITLVCNVQPAVMRATHHLVYLAHLVIISTREHAIKPALMVPIPSTLPHATNASHLVFCAARPRYVAVVSLPTPSSTPAAYRNALMASTQFQVLVSSAILHVNSAMRQVALHVATVQIIYIYKIVYLPALPLSIPTTARWSVKDASLHAKIVPGLTPASLVPQTFPS